MGEHRQSDSPYALGEEDGNQIVTQTCWAHTAPERGRFLWGYNKWVAWYWPTTWKYPARVKIGRLVISKLTAVFVPRMWGNTGRENSCYDNESSSWSLPLSSYSSVSSQNGGGVRNGHPLMVSLQAWLSVSSGLQIRPSD